MAFESAVILVVSEADIAFWAFRDVSAAGTLQCRGISSSCPEQHHLLTASEGVRYMFHQFFRERPGHPVFLSFGYGIDYFHIRPSVAVVAV